MLNLALVGLLSAFAPLVLGQCVFNPQTSPQCWSDGYNLSTDYYRDWPRSNGPPVTYDFVLTNITTNLTYPDGSPRWMLAVNGQIPGPTIKAKWGDQIIVNVTNNLHNGSSIHFHGVRQLNTCDSDGTGSITQCPIVPGGWTIYNWTATQYGTSWYHSHFGVQAWDGIFGGIQIEGPTSTPYDHDLGTITLSDWSHTSAENVYVQVSRTNSRRLENGLINGKNIYNNSGTINGSRYEMEFEQNKVHRLRLINTAADSFFNVSLDGHTMQVIAADFVTLEKPYETRYLGISHGQRYEVLVNASVVDGGSFWFRALPAPACSSPNDMATDIRAIVRYSGSPVTDPPATAPPSFTNVRCEDEPTASLVPFLKRDVPAPPSIVNTSAWRQTVRPDDGWTIWNLTQFNRTTTTFFSDWRRPTLEQVVLDLNPSYKDEQHVIEIPEGTKWMYFNISRSAYHPIHLHGHDFYILSQDFTTSPTQKPLTLINPTRRDVAGLPSGHNLVLAMEVDNPGVWLLHCHIAWHVSQGFALQIVELPQTAKTVYADKIGRVKTECAAWEAYQNSTGIDQWRNHESGV